MLDDGPLRVSEDEPGGIVMIDDAKRNAEDGVSYEMGNLGGRPKDAGPSILD